MGNYVRVAGVSDLAEGTGKTVQANGQPIALFRVDGKFYAIHNTCVHRGGPDRKSTRLNSSHIQKSRMPSSA